MLTDPMPSPPVPTMSTTGGGRGRGRGRSQRVRGRGERGEGRREAARRDAPAAAVPAPRQDRRPGSTAGCGLLNLGPPRIQPWRRAPAPLVFTWSPCFRKALAMPATSAGVSPWAWAWQARVQAARLPKRGPLHRPRGVPRTPTPARPARLRPAPRLLLSPPPHRGGLPTLARSSTRNAAACSAEKSSSMLCARVQGAGAPRGGGESTRAGGRGARSGRGAVRSARAAGAGSGLPARPPCLPLRPASAPTSPPLPLRPPAGRGAWVQRCGAHQERALRRLLRQVLARNERLDDLRGGAAPA
jgi:hypothetical protein